MRQEQSALLASAESPPPRPLPSPYHPRLTNGHILRAKQRGGAGQALLIAIWVLLQRSLRAGR